MSNYGYIAITLDYAVLCFSWNRANTYVRMYVRTRTYIKVLNKAFVFCIRSSAAICIVLNQTLMNNTAFVSINMTDRRPAAEDKERNMNRQMVDWQLG